MRSRVTVICLSVCVSVTALAAPMLSYRTQSWHQRKQHYIYKVFDSWISLKTLCSKVMSSFTSRPYTIHCSKPYPSSSTAVMHESAGVPGQVFLYRAHSSIEVWYILSRSSLDCRQEGDVQALFQWECVLYWNWMQMNFLNLHFSVNSILSWTGLNQPPLLCIYHCVRGSWLARLNVYQLNFTQYYLNICLTEELLVKH